MDQLARASGMKSAGRWPTAVIELALVLLAALFGTSPAGAVPMAAATTGYEAATFSYDASAQLSTQNVAATCARGSPVGPGAVSWERSAFIRGCCSAANTAGSIRAVNPLGGGMNCVNCAVATDATLAGSPASAPLSGPKPISVLEQIYGGFFKPVSGQAEIAGLLTEAGNGARGIVYGSRSGGVGHVFNAVNQGGTIRFLDGQTAGAASLSGFDSFMFLGRN